MNIMLNKLFIFFLLFATTGVAQVNNTGRPDVFWGVDETSDIPGVMLENNATSVMVTGSVVAVGPEVGYSFKSGGQVGAWGYFSTLYETEAEMSDFIITTSYTTADFGDDPTYITDWTTKFGDFNDSYMTGLNMTIRINGILVQTNDMPAQIPSGYVPTALSEGPYELEPNTTYNVEWILTADVEGVYGHDTDTMGFNFAQFDALSVVISDLTTYDQNPELRGEVSEPDANVEVVVNGVTYNAINNGDGTWILPNDQISPLLNPDTYETVVYATKDNGILPPQEADNIGELIVLEPITTDGNDLITVDQNPELTGVVSDPTATVIVTVAGQPYVAVNNGDGTWTLPDDRISPILAPGDYEIGVEASNSLGERAVNIAELIILAPDPEATLISPIFVKWNTFLEQLNFLELVLEGDSDLPVNVSIFNLYGEEVTSLMVNLKANSQIDLDINTIIFSECANGNTACTKFQDIDSSGIIDSYGLIRLEFDIVPDLKLVGRLSNYKPENVNLDNFSFAFARQLTNSNFGTSYATSNTFDVTTRNQVVPNWVEVINLADSVQSYTVNLYDALGKQVDSSSITLNPLEERDIAGGHHILDSTGSVVKEAVYLVEVIPANPASPYLMSLSRYSSNSSLTNYNNSFNYASSVSGRSGANSVVHGFTSNQLHECGRELNYVEVANISSSPILVEAIFRDISGVELGRESKTFPAKGQINFFAGQYLPQGQIGTVEILSSDQSAIIGVSYVYIFDCDSPQFQTAYFTKLNEAGGSVQVGSVNTFIDMDNELLIGSVDEDASTVGLDISSFSGAFVNDEIPLPVNGSRKVTISELGLGSNIYGLLSVTSSLEEELIAENLRFRTVERDGKTVFDFIMPTSVR